MSYLGYLWVVILIALFVVPVTAFVFGFTRDVIRDRREERAQAHRAQAAATARTLRVVETPAGYDDDIESWMTSRRQGRKPW